MARRRRAPHTTAEGFDVMLPRDLKAMPEFKSAPYNPVAAGGSLLTGGEGIR